MKTDESFPEIRALLCSQKPDPKIPPGLENRILRTLGQRKHPSRQSWWLWMMLPPAFAVLALLLWSRPATPEIIISQQNPPASPLDPIASIVAAGNPLAAETTALGRDAKWAGSFLIDCLPPIDSRSE